MADDYVVIEEVDEADDPYKMENAENTVDTHSAPKVEVSEAEKVEVPEPEKAAKEESTTDKSIETLENGQEKPAGLNLSEVIENMMAKDPAVQKIIGPLKQKIDALKKKRDEQIANGDPDAENTERELKENEEVLRKQETTMADSKEDEAKKNISIITACFNSIKQGVSNVKDAITSTLESNAVPSTIVTGTAAGAPNPAHAALQGKALKCQLSTALGNLTVTATTLCYAAKAINYELPDAVTTVIQGIAVAKGLLDKLPG